MTPAAATRAVARGRTLIVGGMAEAPTWTNSS
jgi:hypothetical protein